MRTTTTLLITSIFLGAACAQGVPPPSPGPSLAETMQFIQQKLSDIGVVNFVSSGHYSFDPIGVDNATTRYSEQFTKVVADPATCEVRFHKRQTMDGEPFMERDAEIPLKLVGNILVMPEEQALNRPADRMGGPVIHRVDPPMTALIVQLASLEFHYFDFADADMANRVAKALVHAVQLCGGGSKEPF